MGDKLKPTDIDIENIANAYCRLQFGIKKCSECPANNGEVVGSNPTERNIWEKCNR